jgi:serine phosphatase RsbU (regulator of sigma subunit)
MTPPLPSYVPQEGGPNAAHDALETRTRSWITMAIGLVLALLAMLSGIVLMPRAKTVAIICIAASAVYLAAAFLAHRTRRYTASGAVMGVTFYCVMAATGPLMDGPSKLFIPTSLLFPTIIPQFATYLLGARGGIAMSIATIGYLSVGFVWMLLRPASAGDDPQTFVYVLGVLAIVISLALSLFYTRARTRLAGELGAAHTALDAARTLEQQRLKEEIELAARIQTALLPHDLGVEGLEIAAAMLPAAEVGGDYYDVLPVEGGAWLCIGDVAGHGLNAGLTMLMIQSAVSALAQDDPDQGPDQALAALNTALYQNIRRRMRRDEHATLTLLRYHRDGTVCFAGAHEEILVLRAAEDRCQAIPTPGPWVGARPSLRGQAPQGRLTLADGDLLVLYTDGLTEARDGGQRQFGLERVEAEILRARGEPVEAIREAILAALHAFSPVLADDVALVVARYRAPRST